MIEKSDQEYINERVFIGLSERFKWSKEMVLSEIEMIPKNIYTVGDYEIVKSFCNKEMDFAFILEGVFCNLVKEILDIYQNDSEEVIFLSALKLPSVDRRLSFLNSKMERFQKINKLREDFEKSKNIFLSGYEDGLEELNSIEGVSENIYEWLKETKNKLLLHSYIVLKNNNVGFYKYEPLNDISHIRDFFIDKRKAQKNSNTKEIRLSFSFKSFYDADFLDLLYREKGLEEFKKESYSITKGGSFSKKVKLGTGYYLYRLVEGIKNTLGKNEFPFFSSLITKHPPYQSGFVSFLNHRNNIRFDKIMYLGGADRAYYNKEYGMSIPVCSSVESFNKNSFYGLSPILLKDLNVIYGEDLRNSDISLMDGLRLLLEIIDDKDAKKIIMEKIKEVKRLNMDKMPVYFESKNNTPLSKKHSEIKKDNVIRLVYDKDLLLKDGKKTSIYREVEFLLEAINMINDQHIELYIVGDHFESDVSKYCYFIKKENIPRNIDLYNSSNSERVDKFINSGVPAILVKSFGDYNKNKGVNFIFDIDEVIITGEEELYQKYHLNKFNKEQRENLDVDFMPSKMQSFFIKIAYISKCVGDFLPINVNLLTARGGNSASIRVMRFLEKNNIFVDKALFLNGAEKTHHILKESEDFFVKFIDDHSTHINRVLEKDDIGKKGVMACHYPINKNSL